MGLDFETTEGQTPLDEDERDALLIKTITTRGELDEYEQIGVEKAMEWTLRKKITVEQVVNEQFIKELHRKMFSEIWKWAGEFRTTNKNIGVDKYMIGVELKKFLDDSLFWIEHKTFSEDEIAVRFSHRLVSIHPFANGNGRHARLIADILVSQGLGQPVFSWGSKNLVKPGEARHQYLSALRKADENDYIALIQFARQ